MTAPSLAGAGTAPPTRLVEVADGVHALVQLPGGWCLSNAGVIVGADGAVVIDTLATERRARQLLAAVDELAPGPGRIVLNTHHHGDHTFGNHMFGPTAVIVAHDRARHEMAATGTALTRLWPDVAWGDVRVTLPAITFPDRMTLHIGDRHAELMHMGPAHTTNDVVVWLPDDGVLFAGDVVLNGSTPFVLMGSVRGTLDAVERLRRLPVRTVVCGHGAVAGPEVFDETAAYLRRIEALAADGSAAGLTPLEVAREAGVGAFGHLLDPERIVGNLHRAYAELPGAPGAGEPGHPLDVLAAFDDMVELNGGVLPTCLA